MRFLIGTIAGLVEHVRNMAGTQKVALLHQVRSKDELVELLPHRFFATTVDLRAETIVLEKDADVVFTQLFAELDSLLIVGHLAFDCFDDVENSVGVCAFYSSLTEAFLRGEIQLWLEILVGSLVKIEPEPPVHLTK